MCVIKRKTIAKKLPKCELFEHPNFGGHKVSAERDNHCITDGNGPCVIFNFYLWLAKASQVALLQTSVKR